ncbi:MAG: tyrosine-type recombinase/integrase [Peptostreptococcaceae bacterium]|nr:tyrosine-type recombinase/integrase [Peptostreptococcaceae bacterium]
MLDCCNQENEINCRIYAIILIAVTTGLRACDIATLQRQDIDWKNLTIAIRQHLKKLFQSKDGQLVHSSFCFATVQE